MCEKHKVFFRMKLQEWKKELVKANNEALYNGSMDDNSISADIVDQASSYTDKNVEMKAIKRQIKLMSEIDKALLRIKDDTIGGTVGALIWPSKGRYRNPLRRSRSRSNCQVWER